MNKCDKNSFAVLMHENVDMLLTYIQAHLGDTADADDIFQETMLVAWRRWQDYDETYLLGVWLRGIARKLIAAHFKRLKKRPLYCHKRILEKVEERFACIDRQAGDTWEEKLKALDTCMEHLPPALQQSVSLFYKGNQNCNEIAQTLQITHQAVRKRLQRARILLTDCLRRKGLYPVPHTPDRNRSY